MNTPENSEDQAEVATEDPGQETGFITIPMVEHAAAARIAVPDPS